MPTYLREPTGQREFQTAKQSVRCGDVVRFACLQDTWDVGGILQRKWKFEAAMLASSERRIELLVAINHGSQ